MRCAYVIYTMRVVRYTVTFKVKGLTIVISLDILKSLLSYARCHTMSMSENEIARVMGMVVLLRGECAFTLFDESNWNWPALISEGIVKDTEFHLSDDVHRETFFACDSPFHKEPSLYRSIYGTKGHHR